MPRKSFIILGVLALILVAGILYINYFVPELRFSRINVVSPYQSEARALSEKIADINSFHWSGETKTGLSGFDIGLRNIIIQNSSTIDITNNKFKLDLISFLQFNASSKRVYTLSTELKRPTSTEFYIRFSKANISPEILPLVEKFLSNWLKVDKNLTDQILTEGSGYDFSEERFLESLRVALKTTSFFELTRKFSNDHYSFNIELRGLAEFLAKLFGDLSGQQFSPDEILAIQDSFHGFNISGEVWLQDDGLPKRIKLNWNGFVNADLKLSNFNQITSIKSPAKSVSLEKLLQ